MDAFLADTAPDAYERVVDRLLASPHYGERWARPWLDLARYADSQRVREGQPAHDVEVPRLGDRRAQPRHAVRPVHDRADRRRHAAERHARRSGSPPASTATRCSTRRAASTSRRRAGRRSSIASTRRRPSGSASTIGCAQCHNHKYDPFSQRDYYRLLAFFDNGEYTVVGAAGAAITGSPSRSSICRRPSRTRRRTALQARARRAQRAARMRPAGDRRRAACVGASMVAADRGLDAARPATCARSANGTVLTAQPDGSVLASGPAPGRRDLRR